MNIIRWWKKRSVLRKRAMFASLRVSNRDYNEALKRNRAASSNPTGLTTDDRMELLLSLMVAKLSITTYMKKLGLSWEQARRYA